MIEKKCFAMFCQNCQFFGCTPRLKKVRSYKAVQKFKTIFFLNLLINIVYHVYIDLYIHIYIPNQAVRVAKLCFYCSKLLNVKL